MRHVNAELVRSPRHRPHRHKGRPKFGAVEVLINRDRVLRFFFFLGLADDNHRFAAPNKRGLDPSPFRLRDAKRYPPIDLSRLALAEGFGQPGRGKRRARDKKDSAGVPVQPMHKLRLSMLVARQRSQHPVNAGLQPRSALDREPRGLVKDPEVFVFEKDEFFDVRRVASRPLGGGGRLPLRPLPFLKLGRDTNFLSGVETSRGLGPFAADPDLPRPQHFFELPMARFWKMPLEPTIKANPGLVLLYGAHLPLGHRKTCVKLWRFTGFVTIIRHGSPMPYAFPHRHLIDTDVLSRSDIEGVLDLAALYANQNRSPNKKIDKFAGKTCVTLFFENSTRTRTSFEIAAKRLGADVISVPVAQSSATKGETLLDTALTLDAMQIDALVIRHSEDGVAAELSKHLNAHVLNAGDGKHAHPTQALLDAMTLRRHKGTLDGLNVAICGDLARSRVARSNVHLLKKFGADVRVIAPDYFMSDDYSRLGARTFDSLEQGIDGADAIIMLRIQHERPGLSFDFSSRAAAYVAAYGLTHEKLKAAKPDVLVLHPGPVNRGVELSNELADDPQYSAIREQVEMGVAVRMALFDLLLSQ